MTFWMSAPASRSAPASGGGLGSGNWRAVDSRASRSSNLEILTRGTQRVNFNEIMVRIVEIVMPAKPVLYAVEDAVAAITLNRPERRHAPCPSPAPIAFTTFGERSTAGKAASITGQIARGKCGQDGQLTAVGEAFE